MDCTLTNQSAVHEYPEGVFKDSLAEMLETLRNHARKTNEEWAEKLGIPSSTAISCVKH